MSILDELAQAARERVRDNKARKPEQTLAQEALRLPRADFSFEHVLNAPGLSFICECKKASPSKGLIAEDFPYVDIARSYEAGGAAAISVLTEPRWFLGQDAYLQEIADTVHIPVLRKDFTVDRYMIYEARLLGASAVLLIVAILEQQELEDYLHCCDELGLSALVECHDEQEIDRALTAGARIIGVNQRNLRDFTIDHDLGARLRDRIPAGICYVAESGIRDIADVRRARDMGADAVLVGETLMRAPDRTATLQAWKKEL